MASNGLGESPSATRARHDALGVFAYLWAASTIFHVASFEQWTNPGPEAFAAFWVLFQPGSPLALLALAASQIYAVFLGSPYIPNHFIFAGVVNVTLLVGVSVLR
jgi:hypothetical protein